MKKFLVFFSVFLMSVTGYSQGEKITAFTDIDIGRALIGKKSDQVEGIIQQYAIEYWITEKNDGKIVVYISYNQSIRLWVIDIGKVMREVNGKEIAVARDVVKEVFVRYRHSNLNDLRAFYDYEKPENETFRIFEKELGSDVSHLKIIQH